MSFCQGCLEKQQKIDQLSEENQRLKAQLRYRQRKPTEGFFGSSTPSAKQPVKANSEAEKQASVVSLKYLYTLSSDCYDLAHAEHKRGDQIGTG